MKHIAILTVLLVVAPGQVFGQEDSAVEEKAAIVLALAVESSSASIGHMRSYVELVTGLDPDDQETRLTLLTMAVASAARATAFFEAYNQLLAISEQQPSPNVIRSVGAMERAMREIPDAGAEAFAAETVAHVPVEEIRDRMQALETLLAQHFDTLQMSEGPVLVVSGGLIPSLTSWQSDLEESLPEDVDELVEKFSGVVDEQGASTDDIADLAFEAGRLEVKATTLRGLEATLGLSDRARGDALEALAHALQRLGDEVAEDLLGMTPEELSEKASSEEVQGHLEVLRNGEWRVGR